MARVVVGGLRSIDSQEMVEGVLDQLLVDGDVILSGNAPGVDRMGFVICFWDGQSEGARHMLDIAKRARKLLAEVRPDGYLKLFLNPRGR
ncbi:MAG: hypothetical protein ACUVQ2_00150 [Dissulfurimicrobium sp.]|uniref:hypothetical protein n=1 Tax=Dissulfurimicrobium sp. TaxID=2022436 RepID=UPI00404B369B